MCGINGQLSRREKKIVDDANLKLSRKSQWYIYITCLWITLLEIVCFFLNGLKENICYHIFLFKFGIK